jgi:hypothetical protein
MVAAARERLLPWKPMHSIEERSSGTVISLPENELNSGPDTCCQESGTGSDGFKTASAETVGRDSEAEAEAEDEEGVVGPLERASCFSGEGGGKAVRVQMEVSSGDVGMDILVIEEVGCKSAECPE